MPSISLSRKALEATLTKKFKTEELAERIAFLGTDLEGIEGDEIKVEIFPNRPDLLSQQGFNRAFKSFIGENIGLKKYLAGKPGNCSKIIIDKSVKDVRPYTACALVRGLKMNDKIIKNIIQIQEKLHITYGRNRKRCAIGIYPLENIALPITYTAKKPEDINFIPLESKKVMNGLQILSSHPTGRDYGHLLEGKKLFPIFMDAQGEILSMPPIINSEKTGRITETTKEVFVECSGFAWHVVSGALNMIVTALADMGGRIESITIDNKEKSLNYPQTSPQLHPEEITFKKSYIEKYLGYELSDKKLVECLGKMGIGCTKKGSDFLASVPAYRTDVLHTIDLLEDIAIGFGMEHIEEKIPKVSTIASENKVEIFKNKIRDILIGCGLLEIKNYNITNEAEQSIAIGKDVEEEQFVQVASSSSKEFDTLRKRILPSVLRTYKNNKHHEYPQNVFEIGEVFSQDKSFETGVREGSNLCVALCGESAEYTKIRQILDVVLEALALTGTIQTGKESFYIDGRAGHILIDKKKIGHIGEIAPETLERFDMDMPIASFELDIEMLYTLLDKNVKI